MSTRYTIELEVRRPPLPPGTATTPDELVAYLIAPTVAISKQYEARLSEDSSWPERPEARLCLRQVFGSPTDWAPQLPILPEVTSLGSIRGTCISRSNLSVRASHSFRFGLEFNMHSDLRMRPSHTVLAKGVGNVESIGAWHCDVRSCPCPSQSATRSATESVVCTWSGVWPRWCHRSV